MKVLFIGGTGIISTACTALAAQRGYDLYLLNRGQRSTDLPPGVKVINADIRNEDQARAALEGHTWDSVVDWIAFTPQHVETDIRLFSGKTRQYIFISSASAYQKPVTHHVITESTPLANPYWEYSRNKIACEERLIAEYRQNGFPVVNVRPSHTYGDTLIPTAIGNSWTNAQRLLDGRPVVVHGDGSSFWVVTHNSDFAKGLVGLLGQHQSIGHAFTITGDQVLTWDQIYHILADALGVKAHIVHVTTDDIVRVRPDLEGSLRGDKSCSVIFDNAKIKRFVPDFVQTTPFELGIRKTLAWFRADPKRQVVNDKDDAFIDELVAKFGQRG